jgi:HEPN domain-containing protein
MMIDWLSIISLVLSLAVPLGLFIGRHWLIARVSKGVQHHFDREIEQLRTELRKSEEEYKSDLRGKEAEITALRNTVLAGSAGRQALLDKRRFEAVEKIWSAVNDFNAFKYLSATMALLKFNAVAKRSDEPKMQQFLSLIGAGAPDIKQLKNVGRDERPFVSEIAWAYFNAYTSILYMNQARYMVLKTGLGADDDDPEKYFSTDNLRKILKAALPHQSEFIDKNDAGAFHYLLDELEACLLSELQKMLEGKEVDQAAIKQAKEIMGAVNEAKVQQVEDQVPDQIKSLK